MPRGEYLEKNKLGLIGGGAIGALSGGQIGKGRGKTAGAIIGGLAGALGGTLLEKELKSQSGTEYVIKLRDGSYRTLVQGNNPAYRTGQNVMISLSGRGRTRIIGTAG